LLKNCTISPEEINPYFESIHSATITEKQKINKIILRPNVDLLSIMNYSQNLKSSIINYDNEILEQAEIQIKYERYIEKELDMANRMKQMEELIIPVHFDYDKITALSAEALQKFKRILPKTIGQASRISGVNPSDIQILMVFMGR